HDRRGDDALLGGAQQVHRAVVDEDVDAELGAARDLVEAAVEIVVSELDAFQPAFGRPPGVARAVARDVDPVALLAPAADDLDGRRVQYVDMGSGDGRPVVFVHGIAGNWQNWLENLPRFAQERRVVALDLPGFGGSEDPAADVSIPGLGRAVEALCDQLELGEVALVGNSMGGFIAAETAIQFPERVERLVLVSAAGITIASLNRNV